ncbi:MAG: LiaF transmembrane domain-containing protein [Methylocystaceae bacterium]
MINTMRVGKFVLSLLLIIAGVMGFLINMGYGSWASYQLVGRWWPLLLIIIGAAMFWQGRIPYTLAYIIVVALVAAIIGCMMFNDQALPFFRGSLQFLPEPGLMATKGECASLKTGQLVSGADIFKIQQY